MELAQLEMFVTVVEERSVNRAAVRLCRTQPAVSIALAKLERESHAQLLHRPRRGPYRLTPAGELVYDFALRMLALRNDAIATVRGPTLPIRGRLVLGVSSVQIVPRVARSLDAFREQNPAVRVEVLTDSANRLLADLAGQKIDLVLLRECPPTSRTGAEIITRPIGSVGRKSLWLARPRDSRCPMANAFAEMIWSSPKSSVRPARRGRAELRASRSQVA